MTENINIQRAAVLGAGVMGAQIAAHLVCAGVPTRLYDLSSGEQDPSSIAREAIKALKKLKPTPLAIESEVDHIVPSNYENDLEALKECDFIIEAISERFEWKKDLYQKVAPYLSDKALLASNTSGLRIEQLKNVLPESVQPRFLGIHFFNPPRYMKLLECIPHTGTDQNLLNALEAFLTVRLGKGVVYAKDTPSFIGNRIGVFSLLSVLHHAQAFDLSPDVVDALTGVVIGRPKSATFRTMDVVSLDTMRHVVQNMHQDLKDDPWVRYFKIPDWIAELIEKGQLGQKTKAGIYKKTKPGIQVFDAKDRTYRPSQGQAHPEVLALLKAPAEKKILGLRACDHPQAQFLWACFRDLFHYSAYHLPSIAEKAADIDLSMRWGYGWSQGPFELWQHSEIQAISSAIAEDIQSDHAMANVSLPSWITGLQSEGFYNPKGSYAPADNTFKARQTRPFYKRQIYRDALPHEPKPEAKTVFENAGLSLWTLDDKIGIVSFKSKKNAISHDVLTGMLEAIERCEKDYDALILWQNKDDNFSVGANLPEITKAIKARKFQQVEQMIALFHQVALKLKYARIPTIAAIQGLCLGGGTEFAMHTHKRVAALETYMGLPEVGIGVIPAGGGCKELLYRANQYAIDQNSLKGLEKIFYQLAKAQVSTSAKHAAQLWYLQPQDKTVMNSQEILYEAIKTAQNDSGLAYVAPHKKDIPAFGKTGLANLQAALVNMREGHFISDHDFDIGQKMAYVLCGGSVESGTLLDENWYLELEKDAFMSLVESDLTLARIEHTLATGKPLRN